MNALPRKTPTPPLDDPRLVSAEEKALANRFRHVDQSLQLSGGREVLPADDAEETLIVDVRGELRPSQVVEQKLLTLLRGKALPVSHMRTVEKLHPRAHT
jgi:hypothetical protein